MKYESVKLDRLIKIKNGKDHKSLKNGNYPVYGTGGIMRYVDVYLYDKPSVLLPRKGTLNNIQYTDYPFWTVDTCYYTEVDDTKIIPYFLYCSLSLLDIEALNTGSAIPSMTFDKYYSIKISLPPIEIQQKIVNILKAYDDLIENNKKQIKLLEEAAQRLYKEWFIDLRFPNYENTEIIDGIPKGWEKKHLYDIAPILTGKKDANFGSKIGIYPFFTCSKEPIKSNSYSYDCEAVILAGNGDLSVKLYRGKFEAYQRTYILSPYKKDDFFILYYAICENISQLLSRASGSTIKFITKGMLEDIVMYVPSYQILHNFTKYCESYYRSVEVLLQKINDASEARDRLLFKLMKGEMLYD